MTSQSLLFRALVYYGTRLPHRGQHRVLHLLRHWLQADVDENLEVVRNGLKWVLNPSDVVQADIFWSGHKDYWDVYHVQQQVARDACVYDVGANIGYYSIYFATVLGPEARVFSFEPYPPNYQRLCRHVEMNGLGDRIAPYAIGFSDRRRTGQMHVRGLNSGSANLNFERDEGGEVVELTTLDEFWRAHQQPRIDFLKIDIEGHEAGMLRGAEATVAANKPLLLIELDAARLGEADSSVVEVQEMLRSMGYKLYEAKRRRLVPLDEPANIRLLNAIGFHQDGKAPVTSP